MREQVAFTVLGNGLRCNFTHLKDGAAVAGLMIASVSLLAVSLTGNPIYDPIGSIFVGNLLGMV